MSFLVVFLWVSNFDPSSLRSSLSKTFERFTLNTVEAPQALSCMYLCPHVSRPSLVSMPYMSLRSESILVNLDSLQSLMDDTEDGLLPVPSFLVSLNLYRPGI